MVGGSRPVSLSDKVRLPYSLAVIQEVLRLSNIRKYCLTHMVQKNVRIAANLPVAKVGIWKAKVSTKSRQDI